MADFDSAMMKDMAKLKNINEADELLRGMKESGKEEHKNEYSTFKEVEELRLMVEKQKYLLHAFWLMLKEHGATNEDLDKALNEAVLLSKRTDYKNVVSCPNCGKGLQKMENKPFVSKCYYCGTELEEKEFKDAQEIISQSFEPYDVTKDLGFDEET